MKAYARQRNKSDVERSWQSTASEIIEFRTLSKSQRRGNRPPLFDKSLANDLYQAAKDLNISTLIEVHSKKEAETALSFTFEKYKNFARISLPLKSIASPLIFLNLQFSISALMVSTKDAPVMPSIN